MSLTVCSTSPPYFRARVFGGSLGLLGFEKKGNMMDAINKQRINKERGYFIFGVYV